MNVKQKCEKLADPRGNRTRNSILWRTNTLPLSHRVILPNHCSVMHTYSHCSSLH